MKSTTSKKNKKNKITSKMFQDPNALTTRVVFFFWQQVAGVKPTTL